MRGTARAVADRARALAYLHEEHVWYELPLAADRPRPDLAAELRLDRADRVARREAVAEFVGCSTSDFEGPNDVWVVRDGDVPAFSCWIYHRSTPVLAAPGGWLSLPERTACLEDSVTAPEYRGRGIAPAAWAAIADELTERGLERIVTKVEVSNVPSRKAVGKAGFREVALQRLTRIGPRKRVEIDASAPAGELLAANLRG